MAITDQMESRSPRGQRSYSADIEAIKNYGLANRYSNEQRRNTDAGEAGRRLPSVSKSIIPKAKRPPFATQDSIEEEEDVTQAKNLSRKSDQSQSIIISKEEKTNKSQRSLKIQKSDEPFVAKKKEESIKSTKYHATRSHSAGATCSRTRDTRSSGNSSSSNSKSSRERRYTDTALDSPDWEPPTSFSFTREDVFTPIESLLEKTKQQQQSSSLTSTPTNTVRRSFVENRDSFQKKHPSFDQTCRKNSGINQRIRDLYDFKIETEWPRKTRHPPRKSNMVWMNSGGSEEEEHRGLLQEIPKARTSVSESVESSNRQKEGRKEGNDQSRVILNEEEREERLRIFHDKLRFSEDLGQPINRREKRIYSDDYGSSQREFESEEMVKRTSSIGEGRPMTPRPRADLWDINRPSGASRESWISYAEIEQARRKSRVSDASYVSIDTSKRDSAAEIFPRRAFSQGSSEPTPSSTTPSTPPSSPLTKDSGEGKPRSKSERQGSKFKIYLV